MSFTESKYHKMLSCSKKFVLKLILVFIWIMYCTHGYHFGFNFIQTLNLKPTSNSRLKSFVLGSYIENEEEKYHPSAAFRSCFDLELLSREEEIRIMLQIQKYNELHALSDLLTSKYGQSLTVGEWASAAGRDTVQLLDDLNKGNKARVELLRAHEILVESIARKYVGTKSMSHSDLVQEGSLGLIKAAEKFQPDRGYRFSTFARWWIKATILRAIENKDQMIRLPVATSQRIRKIVALRNELENQNGYQPSEEELADAMGMSVPELRFYDDAQKTMRTASPEKVELSSSSSAEEEIRDNVALANKVKNVLEEHLAPDEAYAVQLRFGLLGSKPKSFNEIGKMMSLSGEGIRKKVTKSLKKIQQTETASQILLDFIL
mmetsp:Transcript_36154/g.47684  ORF Transcript_36154/g.47684 Transcript_36154/m.47684 type:complete len:377 (+) Transcript_36154:175-1305(+)